MGIVSIQHAPQDAERNPSRSSVRRAVRRLFGGVDRLGFWSATSRPAVPSLRQAAAAKAAALEAPRDLWMTGASAVAIILMAGFAGIAGMATWTTRVEQRAPVQEQAAPEVVDTGPDVRDVTVERGDTLAQILIDE